MAAARKQNLGLYEGWTFQQVNWGDWMNENLRRLDAFVQARVISVALTAPPGTPADGDTYAIASGATGAWNTKDLQVARWWEEGDTWEFVDPLEGWMVYDIATASLYVYNGAAWVKLTPLQSVADQINARNTVTALSIAAGVVNIDCSLGDYFTLTLTGNVTSITFSNLPGAGKGASKWIEIVQGAGPYTVAWPASFKWAGGVAGAVSTANGDKDELAITTVDNGTAWKATLAKAFA